MVGISILSQGMHISNHIEYLKEYNVFCQLHLDKKNIKYVEFINSEKHG